MKLNYILLLTFTIMCAVVGCGTSKKSAPTTPQEKRMIVKENLKRIGNSDQFMFGHHDDPVYGVGWEGDKDRSDVKSVCGSYPAVMSFDLGGIELGNPNNLDGVPFDRMREEVLAQVKRGGLVSFSWHLANPVTQKDSWDVTNNQVVKAILPGGTHYEFFEIWLDRLARFFNSLQQEDGSNITVLFRPWHEHTGSWFWWGQDLCTDDEYIALWHMTYEHMKKKGVDNLLYAYSPGSEPNNVDEYLARYPGDSIIDLIGFDTYQFDKESYINTLNQSLEILKQVSELKQLPMAITETGYETIPDPKWWTETLLPTISKYPIAYVLVWRNANNRENHFYAPYPGQVSEADFIEFYNNPVTLFAGDNFELYKLR